MKFLVRVFFLGLLAVAAWLAWALLLPAGPSQQTFVLLRPGIGTRGIARSLKDAGIIRSVDAFLLLHAAHMRPLKAGEYEFDHPASAFEVYNRIAHGDIYFRVLTVPEGYNMFDIASAV